MIMMLLLLSLPLSHALNVTSYDDNKREGEKIKARLISNSSIQEFKTILYCGELEPVNTAILPAVKVNEQSNEYLIGIEVPKETIPDGSYKTTCSINVEAGDEQVIIDNITIKKEISASSIASSFISWIESAINSVVEAFTGKRDL